jgi:hypothetical protein
MFGLFKRKKPKIEDDLAGDYDEEAEAVIDIRARCAAAIPIAQQLAGSNRDRAAELSPYEKARDDCIDRADKLTDEYYRGVAIHHIIEMCAAANEMGVAKALLLAVQDDYIREQILASVPALKTAPRSDR